MGMPLLGATQMGSPATKPAVPAPRVDAMGDLDILGQELFKKGIAPDAGRVR